MATIRQKGLEQWHAQVRRTGWPPVTETLRTRKDAKSGRAMSSRECGRAEGTPPNLRKK